MMLKFKEYLRELTISPDYQQKGTFNPFYTVTPEVEKTVKKEVKYLAISILRFFLKLFFDVHINL